LSKSFLKLVCNVNIVYGNIKSKNSQAYAQKPQRLYVNVFGFRVCRKIIYAQCILYSRIFVIVLVWTKLPSTKPLEQNKVLCVRVMRKQSPLLYLWAAAEKIYDNTFMTNSYISFD
jgi:hypothetical protein